MSEYIRKDDILSAAVEVEYLGRPRKMVSAAKIERLPVIEIAEQTEPKPCEWCKFYDGENCFSQEPCKVMLYFKDEPQTDCAWK